MRFGTVIVVATLVLVLGRGLYRFLQRPPLVETTMVERGPVTRILALTGRIRPMARNRVVSLVPGRLIQLTKQEGDPVATGEVLVRIDSRSLQVERDRAIAEVAEAQAEDDQGRRDLVRAEGLMENGLLSQNQLEAKQLSVTRTEDRLEVLGKSVALLEAQLEEYVLRAPLSGYVLDRPVDLGQSVSPHELIYEIATVQGSLVEAQVDEQYLSELAAGMSALVAPVTRSDTPYEAHITYIGRRVERLSGSAIIRLSFDEEPPSFPADLSVDVNIIVEEHEDVLSVSRAAVADVDSRPWVLLINDGVTERRPIQVINWPAPRLIVTKGLKGGESLVTETKKIPVGTGVRVNRLDDAL